MDEKALPAGTPVEIHGNLNRRLLSLRVRKAGQRISHHLDVVVTIEDASFRVRPTGHQRATSRREVCAHVIGDLASITDATTDDYATSNDWVQVSYDPKSHPDRPWFYRVDNGARVASSPRAVVAVVAESTARTRVAVYVPAG